MRLTDQGSFVVHSSVDRLLPLMTSPDFIGRTLPDSKGYTVDGPDRCTVQMAVGVSHVRGVMPTRLVVEPVQEGQPVTVRAEASGLGSRVNLLLHFRLVPLDEAGETGVRIEWDSDATVSGLLASVGAGLLRPLAQRNFDAIVRAIQSALEEATAGDAR